MEKKIHTYAIPMSLKERLDDIKRVTALKRD